MKKSMRLFFYFIYIALLGVIYLLSVDKYSWMNDMDPSIPNRDIMKDSSNSIIAVSFVFAVLVILQSISLFLEKTKQHKVVAIVLALIATIYYLTVITK